MTHERRRDPATEMADGLYRLNQQLLDPAFTPLESRHRSKFFRLYKLAAEHFRELWPNDPKAALEALIRHAALKLDGSFGKISKKEAAFWLFNLEGGSIFPNVEKRNLETLGSGRDEAGKQYHKRYDEIRGELIQHARLKDVLDGDSEPNIRRQFTELRRALVDVLLDTDSFASVETNQVEEPDRPVSDAVSPPAALTTRPLLADFYVPRPEYEAEIRRVRDSSTRLLWIYGDAGTGKTRLARAANRDLVPEHLVPVLHAADRTRLEQEVAVLLASRGVEAAAVNTTNVWARFGELLTGENAPEVVVFDDVSPEAGLFGLIGATGRSLLIFTSQQPPPPPQQFSGPSLNVGELAPAELEQMLRSRLPHATNAARVELAQVVGGRPLAIEHSAAFIRSTRMSVADYCEALARQPAETLDLVGEPYGRTLTQIYRLTLQDLASSHDALRALDLIVFGAIAAPAEALLDFWTDQVDLPPAMRDPSDVDAEYIRSASLWCGSWPGVEFIDPTRFPRSEPMSKIRLQAALDRLETFGLVRSDNGRLMMHQLTAAILRNLRDEHADQLHERVLRVTYDLLQAENWQGGDPLTFGRLWWAPCLREGLRRATQDPQQMVSMPTDDLIRLATVAGATLRADRQIGFDPGSSFENAARLAAAALFRRQLKLVPVPDEQALLVACRDVCAEVVEYLVLSKQFDRSVDSFPNFDQEPTPAQAWLANSIRLTYHTEWELARHYADIAARTRSADEERQAVRVENPSVSHLRSSAEASVAVAAIHYDATEWDLAIEALEHAYACYLRVGANMACIRGAMDAARRLSRVHLRAGRLEEARAWLNRLVHEVYRPRCERSLDGAPSFSLRDSLLDHQIVQAHNELELTVATNEWDLADEMSPDAATRFAKPRLPLARRGIESAMTVRAGRLLPEMALYVRRLEALNGETNWTDRMDRWFDPEKAPYRHALLRVQLMTLAVPVTAIALASDEDEFRTLQEAAPTGSREFLQQVRDGGTELIYELVRMAEKVGVTHGNIYWHARGLCAAAMLATVTDVDARWGNQVWDAAMQGAENVGRPDWARKMEGFLEENAGLWLLGY